MLERIIPAMTITSLCLLIVMLNIITPASAGPFGVLLIFISAYLSLLGILTYLLVGVSRVITYLSVVFMTRKPFERLTLKRSYYFSTVVAAAPVMLIGLQSVGAVSVYSFLLLIVFVVIGCLYISKIVR
jgi:hypothetical protein